MLNKSLLVSFDFDGTLTDSRELAYEAFQFACKRKNLICPSQELLSTSSLQTILREVKLARWRLPSFVSDARTFMHSRYADVKPVGGMAECLAELASFADLSILSSNSPDTISQFLKKNKMDYFSQIHDNCHLWQKPRVLWSMKKKNVHPHFLYVGDEARDIEACAKVGVESVAVTWGYQQESFLAAQQPRYLVSTVEQLTQLLKVLRTPKLFDEAQNNGLDRAS